MGVSGGTMVVTLRRHAATAGNLLRQYLGSTDQPLCPEGAAEARAWPADPAVKKVYVSGLVRTAETARILYPKAGLLPVAGLNEMDFGAFEGRSWAQLRDEAAYQSWLDGGQLAPCPGGEGRADFVARSCAAFTDILNRELDLGTKSLTVVAHGGTLMAVLSTLAEPLKDYFDWHAPFCGGWLAKASGDPARPLRVVAAIKK